MKFKMTFEINSLKDAAALEDLANELGLPMTLDTVQSEPELPPVRSHSRVRRVNKEDVIRIKNAQRQKPEASAREIKALAQSRLGVSTICKIINGEYDNTLRVTG